MDLSRQRPYLGGTMLRRLLTLLALLTGFAVIGAPVQAQPSTNAPATCEASIHPADLAVAGIPAEIARKQPLSADPAGWGSAVAVGDIVPSPAVLLRVDRARE